MKRLAALFIILLAAAAGWIAWRAAIPPGPPRTGGTTPTTSGATSVLLITIDTLRADALGAYGGTRAHTPAMDALAREGVLFERAYATAPITLTSHASMLTGLYPPGHAARHNGIRMRDDVRTLAEAFKASRAQTGAFISAFPLDRSFGLARGFDVYRDRMPRAPEGRPANERPGHLTTDEAIAWIRERGAQRFFAWVHLFEPHAPYGDAASGRPVADRYADEVSEADRQVSRLVAALGDRRRDTAIVLASDHGEAFGEHGEIAHSIFVYDTTLRVPLIVSAPGVPARRDARPVSLVDLAPTLASLGALAAWDMDGADLRVRDAAASPAGTRPLYAESFAPLVDFGWSSLRTLRSGEWKYIAAPVPELYNVRLDPSEQRNLADEHPEVSRDLAARVDKISPPELPAAPSTVDADARRRLQALGYASGRPARADSRRDPKHARELAAAIASINSGEVRGAGLEQAIHRVLSEDPDNPQANLRLAYLRLQAERCDEAEPLFARAIVAGLAGADAHLGLATCRGRRGARGEALRALEEARVREPENPVVLANLGIAETSRGEHARAIPLLREALGIDPDLHEARFNLALALARGGDRDAAQTEARRLLERLPANAPQRAEVERLLNALR